MRSRRVCSSWTAFSTRAPASTADRPSARVKLETGEVVQQRDVPAQYFGEGIVVWQSELFELTWQSGVAFIHDRAILRTTAIGQMPGRGLGSHPRRHQPYHERRKRQPPLSDPATFRRTAAGEGDGRRRPRCAQRARVREEARLLRECPADRLRAARIDPKTGRVTGWDRPSGPAAGARPRASTDVLNGIAYDAAGDRLFITGKLWPRLVRDQADGAGQVDVQPDMFEDHA